jgi:hypothetical protein
LQSVLCNQVAENEMGGTCSTNGEEERIQVIGGEARGKGIPRKTKTEVGGQYYDGSWRRGMRCCELHWSDSS